MPAPASQERDQNSTPTASEPPLSPLPIDSLLPAVQAALAAQATRPALVLEAPPGAGKTTRVPWLLMDRVVGTAGDVVVLEPRRLAAHVSAARVAEEHGEALGGRVGVQMRFQSIVGPQTRLRYVTEGVLLRQLQRDPLLRGVAAVVLDELHERHLATDLALALLRRLQLGPRPDLILVAMSATLHGERVAEFFGGCPLLRAEGRTFPVEISYQPGEPDEPLWLKVRAALRGVLSQDSQAERDGGDVLVFLPGAAEIRRCQDELAELAQQRDLDVLPLHGDLPFDEQRRAVAPRSRTGAAAKRRKIILATNVAETSLTIDGVTVVIDSGLARVAGHNPWSGLPTLRLQPICRAQATQRAGRAGRTAPGRCLRLYSRVDHDNRPEFEVPEIRRIDLAEMLLMLRATDAGDGTAAGLRPELLPFLDPPPESALDSAGKLLRRLGALADDGHLTALGRQMSELPLHPRLARLVLAAAERGLLSDGAALAALLSERDLRLTRSSLSQRQSGHAAASLRADTIGPSDLLHLLDLQREAEARRFDRSALSRVGRQGVDADVALRVDRARRQIAQALPRPAASPPARTPSDAQQTEQALLQAILCAYPDRVARRRGKPGPIASEQTIELALAAGGAAVLSPGSIVRSDELMVIIDVEDRSGGTTGRQAGSPSAGGQAVAGGKTVVRLASAISADWLLDLPSAPVSETDDVLWNAAAERVDVVRKLLYEQLVLDEDRRPAGGDQPAEAAILAQQVQAAGYAPFSDGEALPAFLAKLATVHAHAPELGIAPPSEAQLAETVRRLCQGSSSFADLRSLSLIDGIVQTLEAARRTSGTAPSDDRPLRSELARLAPDSLVLPGGRRLRIHYEADRPPWVASRLQDFFGLREGPRVFAGRVPVVLQLLAPNQRPVQVTTDLAGFWQRHYPALRRELGRRYPRHAWPEDPLSPLE